MNPGTLAILRRIERLLGEPTMGFLALAAAAVALVPIVFDVAPATARVLDLLDWPIVAVFALEYAVRLTLAPSRRAFVTSPWHVLDLFIILAPIAALLPQASDLLRSTPVLRLVRLVMLGARTGGAMAREQPTPAPHQPARASLEIHVMTSAAPGATESLDWPAFLARLADPGEDWFDLDGVQPEDFARISEHLRIPEMHLQSELAEAPYPRFGSHESYSTLFVWFPEAQLDATGQLSIARTGTLVVGSAQNLATLSRGRSGLEAAVARLLPAIDAGVPFLVRVAYAILKHLIRRYEDVIEHLEKRVHALESLPADGAGRAFLDDSFHLKREVAGVRTDMWHFRKIIRQLAEKRVAVHGFEPRHQALFEILADEADYLYETASNVREALLSLVELRLNVVSFEMNKVMRLLALVTTLALIPTVVGGLLGMNLAGSPWPLSLAHVSFGVGAAMVMCLYVFAVKGWLR